MPETRLNSDVLPALFGPMRPRMRPRCSDRSILSATTMPPNLFERLLILSISTAPAAAVLCAPRTARLHEAARAQEHEHEHQPGEQQPLQRSQKHWRQIEKRDGLRENLKQDGADHGPPRRS